MIYYSWLISFGAVHTAMIWGILPLERFIEKYSRIKILCNTLFLQMVYPNLDLVYRFFFLFGFKFYHSQEELESDESQT